jgi:hypothetical protein
VAPAEWTIRYRTEGLWNELRRDGIDRLEWAAGTLDERYTHGVLRLQVNFKFPREAEGVQVTERRGIGRVEQTGPTDIVYIDESRIGGFYQWEVRMRPTARNTSERTATADPLARVCDSWSQPPPDPSPPITLSTP